MDDSKVNQFLAKIGQIESSGGKNTNHVVIDHGIQKGDSAYGTYGLMPNTIDELAASSKDPTINALVTMDSDQKKEFLAQHPEVEQALAKTLAQKVLTNQGGDEEKAAYAWNAGHNLTPDKIENRDYQNSDYVKKFSKLGDMITRKTASSPMNMAGTPEGDKLMAYLGASPNAATPIPGLAAAGSMGMGGMGGTKDTLALNADQRSQMDNAFSNMVRGPASEANLSNPSASPYTSLLTRKAPTSDEETPVVQHKPQQTPVAPPAEMPQFGLINKLIADYQSRGKK